MLNWFKGTPASVDSILKPLSILVTKLRAHADQMLIAEAEHLSEIQRRVGLATESRRESERALASVEKIGALLP